MMNYQPQQMNTWQIMYNQLLNEYSSLACRYHQQTETNTTLFHHLQNALNEKISLLQEASSPLPPTLPSLPNSHNQEEQIYEPPKRHKPRNEKKRVKRHRNSIKRNGQVYKCTYTGCTHFYHSSISMNQHIKTKHNGGTKKERETYAKLLIESQAKGVPSPNISLNFPPNFIEQFKKKYSYTKKYNM